MESTICAVSRFGSERAAPTRLRWLVLFLGWFFVAGGCAHRGATGLGATRAVNIPADIPSDIPMKTSQSAGEEGLRELAALAERSAWPELEQRTQQFLARRPVSPWTAQAWLWRGMALRGLERNTEAIEALTNARSLSKQQAEIEAESLFQIALAHEASGRPREAHLALLDAWARREAFPIFRKEAELPARLALSWVRLGEPMRAEQLFAEAEAGLMRLRSRPELRSATDWMARVLLSMGRVETVVFEPERSQVAGLARSQEYLIRAIWLDAGESSKSAIAELARFYQLLLSAVEPAGTGAEGDLIVQRRNQEQRWQRLGIVMEVLRDGRAVNSRGAESPAGRTVLDLIEAAEVRAQKVFAERRAGSGPTPEALERRGRPR